MENGVPKNEVIKMKVCQCPYCKTYHWTTAIIKPELKEEQCSFCGSIFTVIQSLNSEMEVLKL